MTEVETLKAQVADLTAQLKPAHEPFDAEVEVTVGILAHMNWKHLYPVLTAYWRQGVSMNFLTAVDSSSYDPTRAILASEDTAKFLTLEMSHTIRSYRFLGEIKHRPNPEETMAHAKALFTDECKTEFIFFNDADVCIPDGALKRLLEEMKADETLGALCIPYEQKATHQLQGAMLMRRDVARRIRFNGKTSCVGWELAKRLKTAGLRMTAWKSGQMAEHGKYWR